MNGISIIFLFLNAIALMALPRRWAPLPLLVGACYMTNAQNIDLGPFHFTVLRLLLAVGAIRALTRNERLQGRLNGLDLLILFWAAWLVFASVFHNSVADTFVHHAGVAYNTIGIYFLIRIFCQNTEDLTQIIKITAILLVPVSLEMISEKITGRNLFALLGGVPEEVMLRDGKLRAQGPFGHPILGGTVGALCLPLMIGIWRRHARVAKIGLAACLGMVIASTSSGPLMSVMLSVAALMLWRWRRLLPLLRIMAVVGYIVLDLVASRPAYYALLNRIDLTGSSTGWHRAELIKQSLEHLNEWWLAGTDYTRHWMPYGVSWSPDHIDITNHYLYYGVWAGLPSTLLFICILWVAFKYLSRLLRLRAEASFDERFMIWSLGAALFAWAVTCISVAFFEQSVMFLYLELAVIGSLYDTTLAAARDKALPALDPAIPVTESNQSV